MPTLLFVTVNVLKIKENYSVMLDPTFGIMPMVLILIAGLWLRKIRIKKEKETDYAIY